LAVGTAQLLEANFYADRCVLGFEQTSARIANWSFIVGTVGEGLSIRSRCRRG